MTPSTRQSAYFFLCSFKQKNSFVLFNLTHIMQAYQKFIEDRTPELKKEYPNLKRSQLLTVIYKEVNFLSFFLV